MTVKLVGKSCLYEAVTIELSYLRYILYSYMNMPKITLKVGD